MSISHIEIRSKIMAHPFYGISCGINSINEAHVRYGERDVHFIRQPKEEKHVEIVAPCISYDDPWASPWGGRACTCACSCCCFCARSWNL